MDGTGLVGELLRRVLFREYVLLWEYIKYHLGDMYTMVPPVIRRAWYQ